MEMHIAFFDLRYVLYRRVVILVDGAVNAFTHRTRYRFSRNATSICPKLGGGRGTKSLRGREACAAPSLLFPTPGQTLRENVRSCMPFACTCPSCSASNGRKMVLIHTSRLRPPLRCSKGGAAGAEDGCHVAADVRRYCWCAATLLLMLGGTAGTLLWC